MVAWSGTQNKMKQRSARPRFRMNMLVVLPFICPLRSSTARTRQFPTVPSTKIRANTEAMIAVSTLLFEEKWICCEAFIVSANPQTLQVSQPFTQKSGLWHGLFCVLKSLRNEANLRPHTHHHQAVKVSSHSWSSCRLYTYENIYMTWNVYKCTVYLIYNKSFSTVFSHSFFQFPTFLSPI